METPIGKVYLTREALVKIAGYATTECYGVVAMAKKTPNDLLHFLLKRENIAQGVELKMTSQGIHVTVNVILELGIRLSEVVRNIREQVAFGIKSMAHLENVTIDVVVCNVRSHEE
ncbi:MAG: Asp23/Gls24 family envelope stress response protein [bacterium]